MDKYFVDLLKQIAKFQMMYKSAHNHTVFPNSSVDNTEDPHANSLGFTILNTPFHTARGQCQDCTSNHKKQSWIQACLGLSCPIVVLGKLEYKE